MSNGKGQWDGKTRGGSTGYLIFISLIKTFGLGAGYALLCLVVPYYIAFAPQRTRSAWTYARKILGYGYLHSAAFLFQSYYTFGQTLIDGIAVNMGLKDRFNYTIVNNEAVMQYVRAHKGCLVIGAHMGNPKLASPLFSEYGATVNIVMYDNEYQAVKNVVEENTQASPFKVIPVGEDDISTIISVKAALDRGELVCFMGDRYMPGMKTETATFMGREARFPAGVFILASRLGYPVFFYSAMREPGRSYRFSFKAAGAGTEKELLSDYVSTLEDKVRNYPAQWFNYYDFWNLYS